MMTHNVGILLLRNHSTVGRGIYGISRSLVVKENKDFTIPRDIVRLLITLFKSGGFTTSGSIHGSRE